MKVYVNELPECCSKCPCMNDDIEYGNHCNLICVNGIKLCLDCDDCQHFRHKDCPLQTTQSLKQQVRKEVCNDFKSRFLATCQIEKVCDTASFSLEVLNRILDTILKEYQK